MSERLRLTFSKSMRQAEFDAALELIQTCGMTHGTADPRTFTVVAYPDQTEALRKFLAVWEGDGLVTADAT